LHKPIVLGQRPKISNSFKLSQSASSSTYHRNMRTLLLLLSLMPLITVGDIYKYTNPNGTVEYSDQRGKGAVEVEIGPLQTYTPPLPKIKTTHDSESQPQEAVSSYQVSIVNPHNEATVRENTGRVEVTLQVKPPIEADSNYTLQLLLDGQVVGRASTRLKYILTNVDRGTHKLQAKLLDSSRISVAQSEIITFYMRRISILFRGNGNSKPGGVQRAPRAPQMPKMPGPPNSGGVTFH
jgi:hypothetical protein